MDLKTNLLLGIKLLSKLVAEEILCLAKNIKKYEKPK